MKPLKRQKLWPMGMVILWEANLAPWVEVKGLDKNSQDSDLLIGCQDLVWLIVQDFCWKFTVVIQHLIVWILKKSFESCVVISTLLFSKIPLFLGSTFFLTKSSILLVLKKTLHLRCNSRDKKQVSCKNKSCFFWWTPQIHQKRPLSERCVDPVLAEATSFI